MRYHMKPAQLFVLLTFVCLSILQTVARAQDKIMGQIQFKASSKAVKASGVWIDGQYVGFLSELGGSNRIRLLPGEHKIVVRQAGYADFAQKAMIEPGLVLDISVKMEKDPQFSYPDRKTSSEVKLDVHPDRAAVFLDDYFVGHVDEYNGMGRGMLVMPGKHKIKIALPGYKAFETSVELLPKQKFMLKTDLVEGSISDADPLIRAEPSHAIVPGGSAEAAAAR